MPRSSSGDRRYTTAPIVTGREMLDPQGRPLGRAMWPHEVYNMVRHALELSTPEQIETMQLGAAKVLRDMQQQPTSGRVALAELDEPSRRAAVETALEVTPSRVQAWKTRNRQMTWPELRVWLVGLKEMSL